MELIKHFDAISIRQRNGMSVIDFDGYAFDKGGSRIHFSLYINDNSVDFIKSVIIRKDIAKKYEKYAPKARCGFHLQSRNVETIKLEKVKLVVSNENESVVLLELNSIEIKKYTLESLLSYHIDNTSFDDENKRMTISGYAVSYDCKKVSIAIKNSQNITIAHNEIRNTRDDLYKMGISNENEQVGFTIQFHLDEIEKYNLIISTDEESLAIDLCKYVNEKDTTIKKINHLHNFIDSENILKATNYFKKHGLRGLIKKLIRRSNVFGIPYETWYATHSVTSEELVKQKDTVFKYAPLISVIVPTFNTPLNFLVEMIDSVLNQSYSNLELCIADGSTDKTVINKIKEYAERDDRIKYCLLDKNYGIAGNTNKALELATGDYIGLFDHDDLLTLDCLYEVVSSLQIKKHDIIYTDEDKTDESSKVFKEPNFKTDFNEDLFYSHNYITHFFVVKSEIIKSVGGFRSEYDGAQDYDVMFRCIEKATSIYHIPRILYHWRMHQGSTAENPESKMYCYEAGKKAIDDHFKRVGIQAEAEVLKLWGLYRIHYKIQSNPLISIIIPNKDGQQMLSNCIDSLYETNMYQNFEIIIVENNSELTSTFTYYEELIKAYSNIRVIEWDKEFNYSAINNFAVKYANGEYLLLLNNDTEVIQHDSISEMLGLCMRENVGIVGAKLLYQDDTIQHAGIVLGIGGFADHVFRNFDSEDVGYMARASINCDYSAVTAACMMLKKSVFNEVDGFDETFKVGLNDVDLCLKVRDKGYVVAYNAFSLWYHLESKTRGYEDSDEKRQRFENEISQFRKKWKKVLDEGDPYYNKNFSLNCGPFKLG